MVESGAVALLILDPRVCSIRYVSAMRALGPAIGGNRNMNLSGLSSRGFSVCLVVYLGGYSHSPKSMFASVCGEYCLDFCAFRAFQLLQRGALQACRSPFVPRFFDEQELGEIVLYWDQDTPWEGPWRRRLVY